MKNWKVKTTIIVTIFSYGKYQAKVVISKFYSVFPHLFKHVGKGVHLLENLIPLYEIKSLLASVS